MGINYLKYLKTYAESESHDLPELKQVYDFVVVIPVCDEDKECLSTVFSKIPHISVLVIVVVNSPLSHDGFQESNFLFIKYLIANAHANYSLTKNTKLITTEGFFDVLFIDRNSDGNQIDSKQGVGLARKIGCDVAVKLNSLGIIKTPWIFSTDADVVLPENYFSINTQQLQEYSALVLDFLHFSENEELNDLQAAYDFKLRYYQAGLCYANSPYNYIPLGSTIVINMLAYTQVRGFPKKNAGEDFYLLNKLAKIKPIKYKYDDTVVKIKSRFSNRVPFGTGPALSKIKALESRDDYQYYNPECFIYLKQWYEYLISLYCRDSLRIKPPTDPILKELYDYMDCYYFFNKSKPQITSGLRWSQFVLQWFDAFRTLKAVHYFNKIFPPLNYKQLFKSEYFAKVSNSLKE